MQKAKIVCKSILKQAFEAKLVTQDPNDEPAERLLERIKMEKKINQQLAASSKQIERIK